MMAGRREEEIHTSSSLSELSDESPVAPDVSDVEEGTPLCFYYLA